MVLCECGCGLPAPVARRSDPRYGYVKGQPVRFVRGHNIKNDQAPWFKGDAAGYGAMHTYLCKHFPKTGVCEECGRQAATDYALIKGHQYSRRREDYRELCRRCHVGYDEIGGSRWRGVVTSQQLAGPPPVCKCGCGELVTRYDRDRKRWYRFVLGHRSRSSPLAGVT